MPLFTKKIKIKKSMLYLLLCLILAFSFEQLLLSHFIAVLITFIFLRKHLDLFNLFTIFLIMEFLIEPVPSEVNFTIIFFVVFLLCFLIYSFTSSKGKYSYKDIIVLLTISLAYLLAFSYAYFIRNIPLIDIVRAMAPFTFFFIFYPIVVLLKNRKLHYVNISFSLIFWGLLYSVNNISLFILNVFKDLSFNQRITLLDQNAISSMPLFLAVLTLYFIISKKIFLEKNKLYIVHLIAVAGILVTQTRSMILVLLLFYFITWIILILTGRVKSFFAYSISVSSLGIFFVMLFFISERFNSLFMSVFNRFKRFSEGDRNVSERLDEYVSAMNVLTEYPLFGGGMGIRFNERYGEIVNYMHNSILYFLANLGLIGLLILILFLLYLIIRAIKSKDVTIQAILFATLSLIVFSLFFSTYKWFFHNMIIGILFGCLLYEKYKKDIDYA